MSSLEITISGNFDRGKKYRARVHDLARSAIQRHEDSWPVKFVDAHITSNQTLATYMEARLLLNMLRGIVYRNSAKIRNQGFTFDNETGPQIILKVERWDPIESL